MTECSPPGVRWQVSLVRCQVSHVIFIYFIEKIVKVVELVGEGLLSTRPTPSSLLSRLIGLHALAPSVGRIVKLPLSLLPFRYFFLNSL